ncbi:MAG: DUF938 domain-containing protein, partial [Planctomycetaceae bacterium]|nr:DUF938 domain-containing protein [Planctomycetaceae bacterium]
MASKKRIFAVVKRNLAHHFMSWETLCPVTTRSEDMNAIMDSTPRLMLVGALGLSLALVGASKADPCPDLDGNGIVNVNDMLDILSSWGPCPGTGDCPGDLGGNGSVGVEDLLAVIGGWGPCSGNEGDGPFNYGGHYTSESNARFDSWLKGRDPQSGIRDFEALDALAVQANMILRNDYEMPANNRILCWQKTGNRSR